MPGPLERALTCPRGHLLELLEWRLEDTTDLDSGVISAKIHVRTAPCRECPVEITIVKVSE